MLKIDASLKVTNIKLKPHPQEANELNLEFRLQP